MRIRSRSQCAGPKLETLNSSSVSRMEARISITNTGVLVEVSPEPGATMRIRSRSQCAGPRLETLNSSSVSRGGERRALVLRVQPGTGAMCGTRTVLRWKVCGHGHQHNEPRICEAQVRSCVVGEKEISCLRERNENLRNCGSWQVITEQPSHRLRDRLLAFSMERLL
jgi:hypothetical protein